MGFLDGIQVDILRGVPQAPKTRLDIWQTPGLDGYGAQKLGLGDTECELVSVLYTDSSDLANIHGVQCSALQGTLITIVDDWADTFNNVLVVHVDCNGFKRPVIKDGFPKVRCEIRWRVLST